MYISEANSDRSMLSNDDYKTHKAMVDKEISRIQASINDQTENNNKYIDTACDFFDFITGTKYQLMYGDMATKNYIFSKLGSNLILHNKKVLFTSEKPFFFVEKAKQQLESESFQFEPKEMIEVSVSFNYSERASLIWRRVQDSNL